MLIAIGVGVMLPGGRFRVFGDVLFGLALGLILGATLAGGIGSIACIGGGGSATTIPPSSGTFDPEATIELKVDCGTANVTTAPGSGWSFAGSGDPNHQPTVDSSASSLSIGNGPGSGLFNFGAARSDWQLQVPTDPTIQLALEMNAGSASLDLSGARVAGLSLTANAGTVQVDLSRTAALDSLDATVNAGDVLVALPGSSLSGSITVNAGHLGLCALPGVGLRIDTSGALASNNFASRGLAQDGNTWTRPGLLPNGPQVSLQVTANAGNIELNPDGGCQ